MVANKISERCIWVVNAGGNDVIRKQRHLQERGNQLTDIYCDVNVADQST